MIVGVRPAGILPRGQPAFLSAMNNYNTVSAGSAGMPPESQQSFSLESLLPCPPGPPVQNLSMSADFVSSRRETDLFPVPDPPTATTRPAVTGRNGPHNSFPGTSGGGVQKHKPTRRAGKGRRSRGSKGSGATHGYTGSPSLAALTRENRRKTRGHFRKGRGGSNKNFSKSGGLYPITPKFALGAPTMRNESLMRPRPGGYGSVREPASSAASAERGIIGVSDSSLTVDPQLQDYEMDPDQPVLDFFGSNEGLIVRREVSPAGSSGSGSDEADSDSDNPEDGAAGDVNLRGVELHLEDANTAMKQRQQEHRISRQAEYILQLEDDNLALRGKLLKMEEEIDSLRRREDDHLNLQERFYLLKEELKQQRRSPAHEALPSVNAAGGHGERIWDE